MGEYISRQAAIDLAVQIIKEWHGLEDDDADAIKYKFMGLPSAQQWIPVTDRCPETSGDYLICDNCKNMYVNEWYSLLHKWQYDDSRIEAWCELPKPWEGEEDATN